MLMAKGRTLEFRRDFASTFDFSLVFRRTCHEFNEKLCKAGVKWGEPAPDSR